MTPTGTILITGGSGTLGHAIARTARAEGWDCRITVYSRSELRQAEMRARHPECRYVLGDVRDYDRLAAAFAGHDLVIHAAAMKRIPECEAHSSECAVQTSAARPTLCARPWRWAWRASWVSRPTRHARRLRPMAPVSG